MGGLWRMVFDLTWPHSSKMTGYGFNTLIEETFGKCDLHLNAPCYFY